MKVLLLLVSLFSYQYIPLVSMEHQLKEFTLEHKEGTFKNTNGINIYYQCWLPKEEVKAVLLIVQAGDDSLVDSEGAQIFYDKVGSETKTLNMYPGLYHEVFNEPEKDMVFEDVETWLERQQKSILVHTVTRSILMMDVY